jgi:hypothetical protein
MKANSVALVVAMACASLGGGIVAFAALGSAKQDAANIEQPRFHATARCEDGTWSWSKNPDALGACASHGGVALAFYQ